MKRKSMSDLRTMRRACHDNELSGALEESSLEDLRKHALSYSVSLDPSQLAQIRLYLSELLRWNQKINLISVSDARDLLLRHVLDSLVPIPFLEGVNNIMDVGSGAGFPGIAVKIASRHLRVFLVEARRKRASFLGQVINKLCLNDIEAIWSRIESRVLAERFFRNPVDCMITRASGAESDILTAGKYLLRVGGKILLMKGALSEEETQRLEKIVDGQERRIAWIAPYRLPNVTQERNLVLIE